MRRFTILLAAVLALAPIPARAQWANITTNDIKPAISGTPITIGASGNQVSIDASGNVTFPASSTDGGVFLPAVAYCRSDVPSAQLQPTRVAASDWALARTAAGAETYNIICSLNSWAQRVGGSKGLKITSVAIAHQITGAALTSATWGKIATVVYANNVANVIGSDLATAPTLPTATQANPYVTAVTVTTPAYLPSNTQTALNAEWTVVMQNLGVYRLYGLWVSYQKADH